MPSATPAYELKPNPIRGTFLKPMTTLTFKETGMQFFYRSIQSPVGKLHAVCSETALHELVFDQLFDKSRIEFLSRKASPLLDLVETQLNEYFAGKRTEFQLPLDPAGTDFQKQAWKALTKIPFGKTYSYAEQAAKLKNPSAVRAVGGANSANPICIIVPCHRVIRKDGQIGGYAGGLSTKQFLLKLEQI